MVEKVKWQVNRDSAEDKLRDFLEWMYALKKDTLHHVRACDPLCVYKCLSSNVLCRGGCIATGSRDVLLRSRKI